MIAERPMFAVLAQQAIYRTLLDCTGYPGRVGVVGAERGEDAAWAALLATLCDESTTLADVDNLLEGDLRRMIGAPVASASEAAFVVARGDRGPLAGWKPRLGTLYRPEFGATLVLVVDRVEPAGVGAARTDAMRLRLTGPGIETANTMDVSGLMPAWIEARAAWCKSFPLGVDVFIVSREAVVSIPRTSTVQRA